MGIWALGYERGVPGYWETIAATFPAPKMLSVKVSPNPTDSRSVTVKTTWDAGAHARDQDAPLEQWHDVERLAHRRSEHAMAAGRRQRHRAGLRPDPRLGAWRARRRSSGKTVLDTVDPMVDAR